MNDLIKEHWLFLLIFLITIPILAAVNNTFSLIERYVKWRDRKKGKELYKASLNYVSQTNPPKALISSSITNVSGEIKFVRGITYYFKEANGTTSGFMPTGLLVLSKQKWPHRLENGEILHINDDLTSTIYHRLYECWRKGFVLYYTMRDTFENVVSSNNVNFDDIVKQITQPSQHAFALADSLSKKYPASHRRFLVSLWQIELFDRLQVHIFHQLIRDTMNMNFVSTIVQQFALTEPDKWYYELEELKVKPLVIFEIIEQKLL